MPRLTPVWPSVPTQPLFRGRPKPSPKRSLVNCSMTLTLSSEASSARASSPASATDAEGALWYASVPGQRCVRVAEGGKVLDTVEADRGCFACMLGGDDGRTLYIVANHFDGASASGGVVLTHPVAVPHAGRP
jgi:hypothetical protein